MELLNPLLDSYCCPRLLLGRLTLPICSGGLCQHTEGDGKSKMLQLSLEQEVTENPPIGTPVAVATI